MKINRAQDVHSVPDWVTAGTQIEKIEKNAKLLAAGIERLNATASSNVDEECLFAECEQIEKCASSQEKYYYNSTWSDQHLSHLKEFASVCGLNSNLMVGVDPTSVVSREANSQAMVRTASTQVQESTLETSLKAALKDPFNLEARSNMDHMKPSNWETVNPEARLSDRPDVAMEGGILPLRGGEDYRISNQPSLASNQNSIADPGALDRLWASEEEGNGERLAREAKERVESRQAKHEEWQSEKVAQMKADDWEAQGVVFPTEVGNVGSGVSSSFMGAYSAADLSDLPERTAGESLASQNEKRKASIQRGSEKDSRDWDTVKEASSLRVSDHFTEELKKRLG
jgi:hypothetical protein